MSIYAKEKNRKGNALVVVNWVSNLFSIVPCNPKLALLDTKHAKVNPVVQAGSTHSSLGSDTASATLPDGNGGGDVEESLEECNANEPEAFVCTDVITVVVNECTEAEGTEGG